LKVVRNEQDACKAKLDWAQNNTADGYVIRFGVAADKLYNSVEILGNKTHYDLNCLNKGQQYYFKIDAYNESGITKGEEVIKIE
jgi:xylan 1,4-beta-xylosidase